MDRDSSKRRKAVLGGPRQSSSGVARFDTIDLMRGLSILAVVLLHTFLRLLFSGYPLRPLFGRGVWGADLFHLLFRNGENGVTVFFAISGFLITLTSLRRFGTLGAMRIKTFYRIRFARIGPLLVLVVGVLSVLALLPVEGFEFSSQKAPLWWAILSAFTFHLNWLEARFGYLPANWDVLWSLSVEEMFYLFFPLLCVGLLRFRRGFGWFVGVLLVFVAMGPFARTVWTTNPIWQEKTYLGATDGIALGCLTALLADWLLRRGRVTGRWLAGVEALGVGLVGLTAWGPRWYLHLIPGKLDLYGSVLALGVCLVMLGSVVRQRESGRGWLRRLSAPLRWYGRHSYEVYLTHEFLVVWGVAWFLRVHPNTNPVQDAVALVQPGLGVMMGWVVGIVSLTGPLGWVVAKGFSEPMNRWLRGGVSS